MAVLLFASFGLSALTVAGVCGAAWAMFRHLVRAVEEGQAPG